MVYSPPMKGLLSPRPRSVTVAALLTILTGCYWFFWGALSGEAYRDADVLGRRGVILAWLALCVALGAAILVSGFALLFRRNWGRILALILAALCLLASFSFIAPFFSSPVRLWPYLLTPWTFPIAAAIAWFGLLARQKVRMELLPPAIVKICVKVLAENSPHSVSTKAISLGNDLFELLPNESYSGGEQHWKTAPGSVVHAIKQRRDGERYLLAVPLRPD